MKKSFTITRSHVSTSSPSTLMAEIASATGSEKETASILRSLERLGTDPSILFYEITRETRGPRYGGIATPAWRVRADRGLDPVVEAPAEAPPEAQPG